MEVSRTLKYYRERKGLTTTVRGPSPALAPGLNAVHSLVLRPPLPAPVEVLALEPNTPDQGLTTIWPHGVDGESPQ